MKASRKAALALLAIVLCAAAMPAAAAHGAKAERLSEPRARKAVKARGARRAGRPVTVSMLERFGPTQFYGTAEWVRQGTLQGRDIPERCFALMEVGLDAKGRIHADLIETGCKRIPPQLPEAHL